MSDEMLFPLTPLERAARLRVFALMELDWRLHMLERHPEKADYWRARFDEAQTAIDDANAITRVLAGQPE